ncbi:MAG: TRAP transporter large permease [Candidatus Rokubacteria bacterium]|nr:TRAP transporter large permease [Candidatus Rokubacteria bacterium]
MTLLLLGVVFVMLLVLGVPIAFTMGVAAVIAIFLTGTVPLLLIPGRMVAASDSFVLLAIPFFILAGTLMEMSGIAHRLLTLARALVAHLRGGLGMAVVVAEMFFSGISGSTVADVSAISSMLLPSMQRAGYARPHSVAIISAASAMGILIPPCINMIILGELMSLSVAALFFAGFLPAAVLAVLIMGLVYVQARRLDVAREDRATWREFLRAASGAAVPLGLPVIMFGGILGGVFTPTEAGAVAVLYVLVFGVAVYRTITVRDLWHALLDTGVNTGVIMLLIGAASVLSYLLAVQHLPQIIVRAIAGVSSGPWFFLLVTSLVFVFIGSLLEGIPAMMIFVPIFLPVVEELGINPLHYGIVVIAAVGIGLFVPPAGVGLIVGCAVGQVSIDKVSRGMVPFLLVLLLGLGILIFVPTITTVVPAALGVR